MRVKIGDVWCCAAPGRPIMVLEDADKANIAMMPPDLTRYACFDDDETMSLPERLDWMKRGET